MNEDKVRDVMDTALATQQQPISNKRRLEIYNWCEEPKETRMSESGMRKKTHLSYSRFTSVVKDWKDKQKEIEEVEVDDDDIFDDPEFHNLSPMKQKIVRKLVVDYMKRPTSSSFFRLHQAMGWLAPQEVELNIGLTAAEHFRIRKEGRNRAISVDRGADGDRGLLPKSDLLPSEVWENQGQD